MIKSKILPKCVLKLVNLVFNMNLFYKKYIHKNQLLESSQLKIRL